MNREELLKKKNVVIVYTGKKETAGVVTDRLAVRCGVIKKVPLSQLKRDDAIPVSFDGLPTDVFETQMPKALRSGKYRPAPGGVCIGHHKITGGTLGMLVHKGGIRYILSNNHVLANSNDASPGDQIWQPAPAAGGTAADTIAWLSNFVPIKFQGCKCPCPVVRFLVNLFHRLSPRTRIRQTANKVDAAIAYPCNRDDVTPEILEIGKPAGFGIASIDDRIKKSGWTSGLNHGTVLGIDGQSLVNYGKHGVARFEDQIVTTPIASGGDSGSAVLNDGDEVVGLLFAGSDSLTLVNKIDNVIQALGLERSI